MRELTLHILDLVQNTIEAEATYATLDIEEDTVKNSLIIRVSDNGRGMDEKLRQLVIDPFTTTRTTRRIGLGLPLMDMSTKMCGGYLKIDSTPGVGTTVEAMYQRNHLDRPPLGNLIDTIKTILVGNPGFGFRYNHTVNEKKFSLAAQELAEALGEVDFSHPEVLTWLTDYLNENISILYEGVDL
jgi:anti-sigma regulatory factor (Ser/Thr protein kinase)